MAGFEGEELAPTELIASRYLPVSTLGEGGMGRVYRAYDTKLRREVALKFHNVQRAGDLGASTARERLVREAQILAKLAHPHVVTVYDVGDVGDVVFVAMELVEGETLRAWQSNGRGPNAIVGAYVAAGEGLAAAHRSGVLHRDFKPENVMVGHDGRVRVVDFGLARSVVEGEGPPSQRSPAPRAPEDDPVPAQSPDPEPSPGAKAVAPTSSGLGTPRYMAPEQWMGRALDARADQYSFCVALYEALEGHHPLMSTTSAEGSSDLRLTAKLDGRGRTASALARGLATDPADRFPTMDDLLRALRPSRRRATSAVLVALVVVLVGVGAWRSRSPCASAGRHITETWDGERRAQIEARFHAADAALGPEVFRATAGALERFVERWGTAQKAACVAARVDRTQSEAMLDRRTACLEEQLASFRALTSTLSGTLSTEDVRHAARAANALPSVEICADGAALLSSEPPAVPAAQRAEVDALDRELRAGWAARTIGRDAEALATARRVVERAQAIGQPGLVALAMSLEGDALLDQDEFDAAAAAYRRALPKAVEARSIEREIKLLTGLFGVLGDNLARHDAAQLVAEVAQAALGRSGVTEDLRALVDVRYGVEVLHAGVAGDARLPLERALASRERLYGKDSVQVAEAQDNLCIALKALGDYEGAAALADRAATTFGERLGPHSIDRGKALSNAGTALKQLGRYDEAIAHYRQALDIWEPVLGSDHTLVALAVNNMGSAQLARGQKRESEQSFRRALASSERTYGPVHPVVARTLSNLADVLMQSERTEEALQLLVRSAAIFEGSDGSHPGDAASTFINLGQAEALLDRPRDAQLHYERAVTLIETKMSPTHRLIAYPLIGLAELFLEQGKPAQAKVPLERLRTFVDKISLEPNLRQGLPELYRRAGIEG